jgi:hypothetical protein
LASDLKPPRSIWILGAWPDLLLIIGTPMIIFLAFLVANQLWSPAAVSSFVMIWAIGHHLPGMMRAYGDPELFRRFWIRFLAAPILLLAVSTFAFMTGVKSGLLTIAAIWGWWHYLMQTYGFVRIYDAKVGSFSASTRWLDWGMCLSWFSAAVVLNDNVLYQFLENFYTSGVGPPSPQLISSLRSVVTGATAAISVLFVINFALRYWRGDRASPIKVLLMISTFAAFWYSAATVTNIIVAYAFFELFHDVQYLTIVWAFNRSRVEKDEKLGGFTRFLFQPRVALIGLYLLMIFGYGFFFAVGSPNTGNRYEAQALWQRMLMAGFVTSTLLHYYFDGFIWKLRETKTQSTLDIETGATRPSWFHLPAPLRHGMLWMLFLVPFGYLAVSQVVDAMNRKPRNVVSEDGVNLDLQDRLRESQTLVQCAPQSIKGRLVLGAAYEANQDYDNAIRQYEEALVLFPDYELAKMGVQRSQRKRNDSVEGLVAPMTSRARAVD